MEPRSETSTPFFAGAATGFLFLTSVYLSEIGVIQLTTEGPSGLLFFLLIFLPFIVFVVRKSIVDVWALISRRETESETAIARAMRRFLRFAVGLIAMVLPGSLVLFGLLAARTS